ncbi:P-loop containing nucleoside triphosphate hydrolase protein [Xylariaceae sp. FL0016]|nr:P-loop containing nucleoside triphosphate hydrolase protein [Xylariaceae sp. FL0016]
MESSEQAGSELPTQKDLPNEPWIHYLTEHRHTETNKLITSHDTNKTADLPDTEEKKDPAFTVLTTYRKTNPDEDIAFLHPFYSVRLHSKSIINALQTVVKYYPGYNLTGRIEINWPYPILVHHYDELTQYRDDIQRKDDHEICEREKGAYEDLGLLLEYLDQSVMPDVLKEKDRNKKGYYTFEHAWVSHKPGTTKFDTFRLHENKHPMVVYSISGGVYTYPSTEWDFKAWYTEYDGRFLGRRKISVLKAPFDGQRKLSFITVGDLERDDLDEDVRTQLKWGKLYCELLKKRCKHYKGITQKFPYNEVNGLVMVDVKAYFADRGRSVLLMSSDDCRSWTSDCRCRVCKQQTAEGGNRKIVPLFYDYNDIDIEEQTLKPHQYFLCSHEIHAYVFRTRTWVWCIPRFYKHLHLRYFSDPIFEEDLISSLVMNDERKKALKALAKSFARVDRHGNALTREPWGADFVVGKGHGLIFLLHGRPGVGKTCTAECIAAFTKRPLMVLTSSDIGTDHKEMAKSWNAVLLIDEADIFLERRSTADLVRNSLVAGFLRALEFFDGILFLTTNRVGSFDDAFISRIHVQLYYPDFDDEQRQAIWKTFMNKLAQERGDYMRLNVDAKDYIHGARIKALKLNGREIRNTFQTAVSLAEYEAQKGEDGKILVTDNHLRAVIELSSDFKEYIDELHQGDEAKRAERQYNRVDRYKTE